LTHLLDTNVCIAHLRSRGTSGVSKRIAEMGAPLVVVCSVVRAELLTGALKSRDPATALADVNSFISLFPSEPRSTTTRPLPTPASDLIWSESA
jgi:tRNA(fMet)-specific endonuclease VapC